MIDARTEPNLVTLFFEQVEAQGEEPFLWAKSGGSYHPLTWRETAAQVSALARGLRHQGIEPGDRVVLVAENRPEWAIADLAIMAAGAITVPAYITNTVEDHLHILSDSGAKGAIVSTPKLAERLLPAVQRAGQIKFVASIEDLGHAQSHHVTIMTWGDLIDAGQKEHWNVLKDAEKLQRTDTACIIYTSGTGGRPKGVMLSHGAILHNVAGAADALKDFGLKDEVFLSFLPLSHSYEHTAGLYFPIAVGAQIYYAEGLDKLTANMAEAHPTIMTAVPRLYEVLHAKISAGVKRAGGLKEKMFAKTIELGIKAYRGELTFSERLLNAVLDRLVRAKVKKTFGGRLKTMVSGGAPLNPDIGLFLTALGVRISQGYGQTESGPVVSCNRCVGPKMDTVGPVFQDTEVRIADDGEILVRGELVMQGYWNNPDATAEAIRDGWLHTGDIGEFDADRHLKITDRKKDIIVNSGGDNIAPQRIEGMLTLEAEIAQAMVYGDKRPHLVAVVVPDESWLASWVAAAGVEADLSRLADDEALKKALLQVVDRVNGQLSNIEKIRTIVVAREAFTIDNGLMTPTMKIRRHMIKDIYGESLEGLYRS